MSDFPAGHAFFHSARGSASSATASFFHPMKAHPATHFGVVPSIEVTATKTSRGASRSSCATFASIAPTGPPAVRAFSRNFCISGSARIFASPVCGKRSAVRGRFGTSTKSTVSPGTSSAAGTCAPMVFLKTTNTPTATRSRTTRTTRAFFMRAGNERGNRAGGKQKLRGVRSDTIQQPPDFFVSHPPSAATRRRALGPGKTPGSIWFIT